jgi:Tfp pilus assembly protein PilX
MNPLKFQNGSILLMSMIVLIALTLLVVFSIRSGNTNLRIAGNAQTKMEANAATHQVIEQVIEQIKVTDDPSQISAQSVTVPIGPATYTVNVAAMSKCIADAPVLNASLNPDLANDSACFESVDSDSLIQADGSQTTKPSACKTQQWEIQAGVSDSLTGAKVDHVQGISLRVPAVVDCL